MSEEAVAQRVGPFGQGRLAPLFTAESAAEAGRKSAAARKGKPWSWEAAAMRVLRQRKPDGKQRRWVVIEKLVELAEAGDVRSIELLVKVGGWRPESIRRHEHTLRQDLIVLPTGDKRGDPVLPAHQTDITPTLLRSSEGTEAGEAAGQAQEQGEGPPAGSEEARTDTPA